MGLGIEGGDVRKNKHSLWQDTQTCACQNKTPASVRGGSSRAKQKKRGAGGVKMHWCPDHEALVSKFNYCYNKILESESGKEQTRLFTDRMMK